MYYITLKATKYNYMFRQKIRNHVSGIITWPIQLVLNARGKSPKCLKPQVSKRYCNATVIMTISSIQNVHIVYVPAAHGRMCALHAVIQKLQYDAIKNAAMLKIGRLNHLLYDS